MNNFKYECYKKDKIKVNERPDSLQIVVKQLMLLETAVKALDLMVTEMAGRLKRLENNTNKDNT